MNHLVFTDNLPDIKSCDIDYLFEVAEYFFRLSITARREGILALEDYFSDDTWKNEEGLYLIERDDKTKSPVLRPYENRMFTPIVRCATEGIESDKIIERAEFFLKKSCQSDLEKFALIIGVNSILAIQDVLSESNYIVRIATLFGADFVGECERRLRKMSNDIYIARYKDKLCEVHLDYFGREYRRTCEVFVSEGTIEAEFGKGSVKMPDGTVINCNEEANMRFVREINHVLDIMEGKAENINTPEKANKVLALTLGKEI